MKKTCVLLAELTILAFAFTQTASTEDRYVATNATGDGSGSSWANATNSIQGAINEISGAYTTNTVWVSNGVYEVGGVTNYPPGGLLTNRVAIWKMITVRSKDNDPTNTIIKGAWNSAATTNGPAAVRCVYMTNYSSLIGFTLTNGATLATGPDADQSSGGIYGTYLNSWTPASYSYVSNCIIAGNAAAKYCGGASTCSISNSTIIGNSTTGYYGGVQGVIANGCIISRNSAGDSYGGGSGTFRDCLISYNSALVDHGGIGFSTLYSCRLIGNSAGGNGGGTGGGDTKAYDCTYISNSALRGGGARLGILSNCLFVGNSSTTTVAYYGGGGVQGATLFNCTVASNSAVSYGGGVEGGTLSNCLIIGNSATVSGGGAYGTTMYNCLIAGNESGSYGGGVGTSFWVPVTLYNCTIVGNKSRTYGGGIYNSFNINCIIYSNTAVSGNPNWWRDSGHPEVTAFTNSCTTPDVAGYAGYITNNPMLVDYGSNYGTNHVVGNYRLQGRSPCVNTGTNQNWMTNALDLDGRMRIRYRTIDMGAYEAIYDGSIYTVH